MASPLVISPIAPSAEPFKRSVQAAFETFVDDALDLANSVMVSAGYTDLSTRLKPPAEYTLQTIRQYDMVTMWPTLSISSIGSRATERQGQQYPSGLYHIGFEVDMFIFEDDRRLVDSVMDRYGYAMWLVMVNADHLNMLNGAQLDMSSLDLLTSEPGGVGLSNRVIELAGRVTVVV